MSEPGPVQRFFAAALIGVGFLMMVLCGGCGALFLVGFLISGLNSSNPEDMAFAIMPLILGGVPAAMGLGLFIAGRALRKPPVPPGGPTP